LPGSSVPGGSTAPQFEHALAMQARSFQEINDRRPAFFPSNTPVVQPKDLL
jgi:hypothetical protein